MSYPMKKLVIENDEYEIVDDSARTRLDGHDTSIAGKADVGGVSGDFSAQNFLMELDTTAASGTTDGDLYAGLVELGWDSEVIIND